MPARAKPKQATTATKRKSFLKQRKDRLSLRGLFVGDPNFLQQDLGDGHHRQVEEPPGLTPNFTANNPEPPPLTFTVKPGRKRETDKVRSGITPTPESAKCQRDRRVAESHGFQHRAFERPKQKRPFPWLMG